MSIAKPAAERPVPSEEKRQAARRKNSRIAIHGATENMMGVLQKAGRRNFTPDGKWERALCALLLAFEPKCKTHRLLEALPYKDQHLDEIDTLNAMAHLGYFARKVGMKLEDLDDRLLPGLFVTAEGVPFVVFRKGKRGVSSIPDNIPVQQKGSMWLFQPYDESRPSTSRFARQGSGQSWFAALLRRFQTTFVQVMAAGLILNLIALSTPLFIMLVYDRVIAANALGTLPMLSAGVALAIVFEWALRRVRARGLSWLAARLDNIVGNRIFAQLIGMPTGLIERASVAAQIARIKTFEAVRDFFSGFMFLSLLELPYVFIALIAIIAIAGPLVFVPAAMIGLYVLLFVIMRRRVKVAIRFAAKASSSRQQFTIETFGKIGGLRSNGLAGLWQAKFRELYGQEMHSHYRLNFLGIVAETLGHALTIISAVLTLAYGVHLIWAGEMSTGALVASMILVWRVLLPFYSLCTMIPRLEQLRHSIMQVNMLMDLDTEAQEAKGAARLPQLRGRVTFAHAGLRYSDEGDPVFSDLSFDARPGDFVAITGENGAGKTSLLKLIKGLHKAQLGAVQIDGFDIRQLDAVDLRRQISYIPQSPEFFYGSVAENLRHANPLATEDDMREALLTADAWNEVNAMPNGLATTIGRYGSYVMPSGLLTRLSLARAYLHPTSLLLIDEIPNTLLSGVAGKNLREYIAQSKGRRTILMVTYREDFMQLADSIVLLQRNERPLSGQGEKILQYIYGESTEAA